MKSVALTTVLLFASASVQAGTEVHTDSHSCNVSSDYSFKPYHQAFVFSHDKPKSAEIGIGGGRLFIDGKEQTLTAADHERLRSLEGQMHALMPQLQQIAVEAVDIAFAALTEVARGMASHPAEAVANLDAAHHRVRAQMDGRPVGMFDEDSIASVVKPILSEYIPEVIGGAVSGALSAAFGGEKKANEFEQRMQRMEKELNTKVEMRAKALEPLADAMCVRLQTMDRLDNSLEFRLPDGDRLELLRVEKHERH